MEAEKFLDRVIYTASLATDSQQIDSIMDDVRIITASRGDKSNPLTYSDQQALADIQHKLEDHLVTQEKVRFFTRESLALQIEQHMQGSTRRERFALRSLVITILAALFAAVTTLLLPGVPGDISQHIQLAGSIAFAIIHLGAAWLFMSALSAFKTKLRHAFIFISFGILVLSVGLVLQPMVEIFDWRRFSLITIIMSAPTLIAGALTYVGVRKYTLLVGAPSRWTSLWSFGAVAFTVVVATPFLPYIASYNPSPIIHHTAAIIQALAGICALFAFANMLQVGRRVADLYKPAARAYVLALGVSLGVSLYMYGVRVITGVLLSGIISQVAALLLVILGISLIYAAYKFNKVSRY